MDQDRDGGAVPPSRCAHGTGPPATDARMSDRPTLEQQLARQRKRLPQTPRDAMRTTRERINALLAIWFLISCVLLVAAAFALVVLIRMVV
jgi:hypothetical protein